MIFTSHEFRALLNAHLRCLRAEVVKTKMMTGSEKSTQACIRKIVQVEGIMGLYTGFWSLVLRELPFNVIEM